MNIGRWLPCELDLVTTSTKREGRMPTTTYKTEKYCEITDDGHGKVSADFKLTIFPSGLWEINGSHPYGSGADAIGAIATAMHKMGDKHLKAVKEGHAKGKTPLVAFGNPRKAA